MDIKSWLEEIGMGEYWGKFEANKIDEATLKAMTEDDLKDIGIDALGDRKKLKSNIDEYITKQAEVWKETSDTKMTVFEKEGGDSIETLDPSYDEIKEILISFTNGNIFSIKVENNINNFCMVKKNSQDNNFWDYEDQNETGGPHPASFFGELSDIEEWIVAETIRDDILTKKSNKVIEEERVKREEEGESNIDIVGIVMGFIAVVFLALLKQDGLIESMEVRRWMLIGAAILWTIASRPYVSGTFWKIFGDRSMVKNRSCKEIMTLNDRHSSWFEVAQSYILQFFLWAFIAFLLIIR